MTDLISLDEAMTHLRLDDDDIDDVQLWLSATTEIVEFFRDDVIPKTYTETHDGGGYSIVVFHCPIISVTSLTEYVGVQGYPLTLQPYGASTSYYGYSIDNETGGIINRRGSAGFAIPFQGGADAVKVTYTAGLATVPASVQVATRIILQHLWESRRGAAPLPLQGDQGVTLIPGLGYAIPNQAIELMNPGRRAPGIG